MQYFLALYFFGNQLYFFLVNQNYHFRFFHPKISYISSPGTDAVSIVTS